MSPRQPWPQGSSWAAFALLLAGVAAGLFVSPLARSDWDWQPAQWLHQPWRWWSAAWVHWTWGHLLMNSTGCLLLALLGWRAALPHRATLAWALAWPLGQLGLLLQPGLAHYGGLSGLLHAGVAVAVLHLLCGGSPPQRRVAAILGAGLLLKLLVERPDITVLHRPEGWGFAVAPLAHASGVVAGALLGACSAWSLKLDAHQKTP